MNNFGPRKRVLLGAGIIPTSIRQIVEREPVVLFDRGQQVLSFLNVHDTVRATMIAFASDKANDEIFLLANPTPSQDGRYGN